MDRSGKIGSMSAITRLVSHPLFIYFYRRNFVNKCEFLVAKLKNHGSPA
jgi:hypothetical protein